MSDALWARVDVSEAAIVRKHMRSAPVKVGAIAEELGMRVTKSPLPPTISGLIRPASDTPSKFEIVVNKYESPERQRFTVAHEIGHFLLHRGEIGSGVVDSIMYRSALSSRMETEANKLAASIVMPEEALVSAMKRFGDADRAGVVEELAEDFRVSAAAMQIRLGVA